MRFGFTSIFPGATISLAGESATVTVSTLSWLRRGESGGSEMRPESERTAAEADSTGGCWGPQLTSKTPGREGRSESEVGRDFMRSPPWRIRNGKETGAG